jgi:PadR family transcriptional regulator, regulatory protein PadR
MNKSEKLENLLEALEFAYKKGHLTFWVLLSVRDKERYSEEINSFIEEESKGYIKPEIMSLYRTLRKLEDLNLVSYKNVSSDLGPEKKYFSITDEGLYILNQFIKNNIYAYKDITIF